MTFFNKKEEVLDVQLTQLGKYLLSKGKFKPVFYVFSDDEILYDTSYVGGPAESARETSNRIQKDTVRFRALYEHEGVESRVLSLNGHKVEKPRGHAWQARIKGRTEELPLDQSYGTDTIEKETMGADDRNLIRNFIGNSTVGESTCPSWNIDSLMNGDIERINISSSSPNVGIKRPVIHMEVEYLVEAEPSDPTKPSNEEGEGDYLFVDEYEVFDPGHSQVVEFKDGFTANISDNRITLSIMEENVDYDLENFEFEFYEIEQIETISKAGATHREVLRKLYFKDESFPEGGSESGESIEDKYIEHYFNIIKDDELAEEFGISLRGVNRFNLRDKLKHAIMESEMREDLDPFESSEVVLANIEEDCD